MSVAVETSQRIEGWLVFDGVHWHHTLAGDKQCVHVCKDHDIELYGYEVVDGVAWVRAAWIQRKGQAHKELLKVYHHELGVKLKEVVEIP